MTSSPAMVTRRRTVLVLSIAAVLAAHGTLLAPAEEAEKKPEPAEAKGAYRRMPREKLVELAALRSPS